jgi:HlyD family secretion protein
MQRAKGRLKMQSRTIRRILATVLPLAAVGVAIFYLLNTAEEDDGILRASGTVEAVEVIIASELPGRVADVFVEEGDTVQLGDLLFRLEDETLQAQRRLALAGLQTSETNVEAAQASVDTAKAALENAQWNVEAVQLQYKITLAAARLEENPYRIISWKQEIPYEFILPVWYFQKTEKLTSAEAEVAAAKETLEIEQENFQDALERATNDDLQEAERRLCDAQVAFIIAEDLLDRARQQNDQELEDFAQTSFDTAKEELEAAQTAYDEMLSDEAEGEILDARARLILAQERYETAQDHYNSLQTGEHSLQVQAAEIAVQQSEGAVTLAQAQVAQAEASLIQAESVKEQTQAEIDLIDIQIQKLEVISATSGIVRSRNIEPGEVLQAGAVAMTLDRIDTLIITVFIPEDRYGQIVLGDHAQVNVDSFPGVTFDAVVTRIADRAEFTPRNVQTEEGRRTTVFAVELSVQDADATLKPGMPADVTFGD